MAMPRAAGLFRRAIAQSMPGTFATPELAADITRACAAELGLKPAELPTVDPRMLPAAGNAIMAKMSQFAGRWGKTAYAQIPFAPVVDGEVLPTTPWERLTGQVDLVVGHTRDEQRLLAALGGLLGQITEAQATGTTEVFAPDPQRYRESFPDPEERYEVVRSDWLFRMPSLHLPEAQLRAGGVAYLYELTWPAPGMGGGFGACHGLTLPLVFGNITAGSPAMLIGDPGALRTAARTWSAGLACVRVALIASGGPAVQSPRGFSSGVSCLVGGQLIQSWRGDSPAACPIGRQSLGVTVCPRLLNPSTVDVSCPATSRGFRLWRPLWNTRQAGGTSERMGETDDGPDPGVVQCRVRSTDPADVLGVGRDDDRSRRRG